MVKVPEGSDLENPVDGSSLKSDPENKEITDHKPESVKYVNELNGESEIRRIQLPKIVVLNLSLRQVEPDGDQKNDQAKNETRLFYKYYKIKDFDTENYVDEGELYWEHSEPTSLKAENEEKNSYFKMTGAVVEDIKEVVNKVIETK